MNRGGTPSGTGAHEPLLGSVVVPAHQEAGRIGVLVRSLREGWRPGELDVVVVSNGSTDGTAEAAEAAAADAGLDLRVLDLEAPGKAAALKAGDQVTRSPRLYLDADVRCSATTARALLRAVGDGRADVAVPRRVLDLSGCTRAARMYHCAWAGLPWVEEQLAGRGAYCLSERAGQLLARFPAVMADDRLATTLVPSERAVVLPDPVVVTPPRNLREVLVVRRRVYFANQALERDHGVRAHERSATSRVGGVVTLLREPGGWPGLVLWAGVTAVAKVQALAAGRRGGTVPWRVVERAVGPAAGVASVSVVVVSYRSSRTLGDCLQSISAQQTTAEVHVVVVDNASDDGSVDVAREAPPGVRVIRRGVNDGFGRGCTVGVEGEASDLILFCNPDVVLDAGCVDHLVQEMARRPEVGVVGGRQRSGDGGDAPRSWWRRPSWWSLVCFATGVSSRFPRSRLLDPEEGGAWDGSSRDVDLVSGGLMLVRRRAWSDLGGFDPDILLYGEDVDLCLRARAAGWGVRVCGAAAFVHDVGASTRSGSTGEVAQDAGAAVALRLQLVLRGRATVLRRHLGWPAVRLVEAGVALRSLVAPLFPSGDGARRTTGREAWAVAWRTRRAWRRGWREGDDLDAVIAEAAAAARQPSGVTTGAAK